MFADCMLETSWAQRTRRSWTTLTSFGLQTVVIGVLLMIPLLTTVGLPSGRVLQPPISLGAPPPPTVPVAHERVISVNQSNLSDNMLITPPSIPRSVKIIDEVTAPPQVTYNDDPGVVGSMGEGSKSGIIGAINDSLRHNVPTHVAPPASVKPTFRPSSLLQGSLIRRLDPVYPPLARTAHIQGPVVLAAIISKAGNIEHLQLISGHPMLVPAAIEAVSQWRYRPYILNGEVIEVETQITVNFRLSN